jgi:hypothetical protein
MLQLQDQLAAADRMVRPNYIRTIWNEVTGQFEKVVTNYPLGQPGAVPYLGVGRDAEYDWMSAQNGPVGNQEYPWSWPGGGYGLPDPTGPVTPIVRRQVVGAFVYQPAAQMSQEYDFMYTDTDPIRGKFTEMVTNVKYDSWVIEGVSHGIIPIIDAKENVGEFALPVKVLDSTNANADPEITDFAVAPAIATVAVNRSTQVFVTITGNGPFDNGWTAVSSAPGVATVDSNGVIRGISAGSATITFTSVGDPTQTATVTVTVA